MKYQIPETFMGRPVEGAMERALAREETKEPEKRQDSYKTKDGFIYVPKADIEIATTRTHLGKNWTETQEALKQENLHMPTIAQFRDYLDLLHDSIDPSHQELYNEITEVRDLWRSNWLNAKFEQRGDGMYMASVNAINNAGDVNLNSENILTQDKLPGISLEEWIKENAKAGIPSSNIPSGELYYWHPRNGSVARFCADSDGAILYCDGDPVGRSGSLGVFACAEGTRVGGG